MSRGWDPSQTPDLPPISPFGWGLVILRGSALLLLLLAGVLVFAAIRLIEIPLYGPNPPVTPRITQWVCRAALRILGLRARIDGRAMDHPGALVANHASWLDIFVLNACTPVYFVSKSEVASWPGIGFLARLTGTVFITRDPRQARSQTELFKTRLKAGHRLLFFPEGTSTDGRRVLPFKTPLFQSFFDPDLRESLYIQPLTVIYRAPEAGDDRFYGWWGDMAFGPHLLRVLAVMRQGMVSVAFHQAEKVNDHPDRKAIAEELETAIRAGLSDGPGPPSG